MTETRALQLIDILENLLFEIKKDQQSFITVDEVAKRTSLSVSYLNALRATNEGPLFTKVGGRVLYDPEDVKRWAQELPRSGRMAIR